MQDERHELDALFSLAYEELRRLAAQVRGTGDGETFSPTVLVHEAWIRMAGSPGLASVPRPRFKQIAARAMRQVLVDAARRRNAAKRGGGAALVTLDEPLTGGGETVHEVLALDQALQTLSLLSPRQASLVEARFFGGLEMREVATALEISEATAHRDWRAARAWLARELRGES